MNKTTVTQQAKTSSFLPPAQGLLQRKCACGNHTVAGGECAECAKNKSGLQRKLTIGSSNDPLEQEADRVADQVLAAPSHSTVSAAPPRIQRYAGQAAEGSDTAPASLDHVLTSSGRPLEPALRQDMELRFGHDFSRVRVHSGSAAEQSARDVNANAYTVGHNIVFDSGRYSPGTHEGRRLIAHELTHVVQQQGTLFESTIQREINPACAPFLERNKSGSVCKPPPKASTVGNDAHKQIQAGFVKEPDQLVEIPIPGSGNVCSEIKIEPLFAQGRADLVKVVNRGKETVRVEIAEIKPMNEPGISLGPSQLKCYQEHLRDVGTLCKYLGNYTPDQIKQAEKDPRAKLAVQMCKRLNAFGKTVTVSDKGLSLPPQSFELYGRPMNALTCFKGVVCYSCLDPEQESKRQREPPLGEVIANPGSEVAAGFVTGFLAGAKRTIPVETWTTLFETLSRPSNLAKFTGGQFVGRPLGVIASLEDLLGGLAELLKLAIKTSPAGIIASELIALSKSEESPTIRRARMAKDIAEGLQQLGTALNKNPNLLFESGEGIGDLCGEEAGKRFLKEFVAADPFVMGVIVGKVQGYLATEIAMLLVGAEELAAAGKGISAAARAAKASRFGLKILEVLETIPAFKRLLTALRGASKIRVAPEVGEEAAKAQKALERARELKALEEADKAKTLKAREAQKALDAEKTLQEAAAEEEALREAAESRGKLKKAR